MLEHDEKVSPKPSFLKVEWTHLWLRHTERKLLQGALANAIPLQSFPQGCLAKGPTSFGWLEKSTLEDPGDATRQDVCKPGGETST